MDCTSSPSSSLLLLFFLALSLSCFSSSIEEAKQIKDVDLENPVLHFTPSRLDGYLPSSGSHGVVSCERVRVVGVSRLDIKRYANSFRVTLTPSVAILEKLHSKIEVCFHRNASLGFCKCAKDEWRTIQKGQWNAIMSPYGERYVDVKVIDETYGFVTVSVEEDFQQWRLYCLVFGFLLMLLAPLVSDWVPFYYSSSMAVGVLLVALLLLFQGMKLLPTGRKSAFYFTMYGSLLGLGSYLVHYFSMLINSILMSFGLSEDMYNPVSIFVGVGLIISGAALGYWIVRKYVISEDGSVDAGIAQFVKWAVRIVAMTFILQSTLDIPLAMLTLVSCGVICSFLTGTGRNRMLGYLNKTIRGKRASGGRRSAEFLRKSPGNAYGKTYWSSPKRDVPWTPSPTKGCTSPSTIKQGDYYSTFGNKPKRRLFSKKEWEDFTMESTKEALAELASSPEFTDWIVENADRIQLEPEDSSDESLDSGAVSSEETIVETSSKRSLFSW